MTELPVVFRDPNTDALHRKAMTYYWIAAGVKVGNNPVPIIMQRWEIMEAARQQLTGRQLLKAFSKKEKRPFKYQDFTTRFDWKPVWGDGL